MLYIGLSGLATDAQTLYHPLVFKHKLYQLREVRDMNPRPSPALSRPSSTRKKVWAILLPTNNCWVRRKRQPFICTMDCIGGKELAKYFGVSGTASESLYGACESMCKPDMGPEELFETILQALLSSFNRDFLSGWGGYALTEGRKSNAFMHVNLKG